MGRVRSSPLTRRCGRLGRRLLAGGQPPFAAAGEGRREKSIAAAAAAAPVIWWHQIAASRQHASRAKMLACKYPVRASASRGFAACLLQTCSRMHGVAGRLQTGTPHSEWHCPKTAEYRCGSADETGGPRPSFVTRKRRGNRSRGVPQHRFSPQPEKPATFAEYRKADGLFLP